MARRKGKSERRIKDWHSQYNAGEARSEAVSRKQSLSKREIKLRGESFADSADLDGLPTQDGMIVGLFPGWALVRHAGGELLCGIAKTFRAPEGTTPLTIGDDVTVALTRPDHTSDPGQTDMDRADGMVLTRRPRRTALARPRPRSGKRREAYDDEAFEKVVVANMDVLLIVVAARQPRMRRGLIDRFLIVAERGELEPILVVNKIDLGSPDEAIIAGLVARGTRVICCSAATGEGLADLAAALARRRSVLAGASGVGKSTLINAILPEAAAATRPVRTKDNRGRHTTAASRVYALPGEGMLVDTPGVRELGLAITAAALPWYFPEFEPLSPGCKFNNCSHTHEPDCAILAAVEAGLIPHHRYESYLRLLESLDER